MALNRREFLGVIAATGFASQAKASTAETDSWIFTEQQKTGYSIMQGMTDETSAQFSLLLPKSVNWKFDVVRKDGVKIQIQQSSDVASRPYSRYAAYRLMVEGLELGVPYVLQVQDAGGRLLDQRDFAALDLSKSSVRIGFLSCILDLFHRDDIWNQLATQKPEVLMFLGDNVYADRTSWLNKNPADEKQLWERYVLTRNRVAFYFQRKLIPVIATWDDHDFGMDNGDHTYPCKNESHQVFETFFPQSARPSLIVGPGIARKFTAFGADFFFMDGRTFRGENNRMFGEEQERWFFDNIGPNPTMILNGSQFFGAYTGAESFEGSFAADFAPFLRKLKETQGLFSFVSGDVHFSEVMDIESEVLGYPTVEIVSSAMHSYTFPGHEYRFTNPRRRVTTGSHNFMIFDAQFFAEEMSGRLISYGASGEEFRTGISVYKERARS
jgi:hypothetical protein